MKVYFLSRALLEPIDGTDQWEWGADFSFSVDDDLYVIKAGTRTDLDSVPRLPFIYWIAKARARKSAGIHDFLYSLQAGKDYADDVFAAAMLAEQVKAPYRGMIYGAVRMFGHSAYDSYASQN
jgi:hypothetical protein